LSFVQRIAEEVLKEIKAILREYLYETEAALKKRLRKILITGIIIGVLMTLVISLLGSAVIFILIGWLKYLETSMPAWEAWGIVGLTSGVVGGLLFLVLITFIRRQLRSG
jgi:di/tricarboxylate transporter